ncbi:Hint domain-containing protein [Gymnodinialimonas ulvae]|uniref:Hint domain-containing protein n=1 Tax=Gymnodinialimonas ulvae TaxID=3126504 RepID=UPI0030B4CB65
MTSVIDFDTFALGGAASTVLRSDGILVVASRGAEQVLAFERACNVQSMGFRDVAQPGTLRLFSGTGDLLEARDILATGANSESTVVLNATNVTRVEVALPGAGRITTLELEATAIPPDFIVEGGSGDDLIDSAYDGDPQGDRIDARDNADRTNDDDVLAGAGDDTVDGAAGDDVLDGMTGDDLILGGSGSDVGLGGAGDDTLFGDSGTQDNGAVREVFQWSLGPADARDFSQNTGNVTVAFFEVNGGASDNISTETQLVDGIDTGGAPADVTSSLDSETGGQGNSDTYTLDFSDPVENMSFRINDVDGDGLVTIRAFHADGSPVDVALVAGSDVTLRDTDGDGQVDTADSDGGYLSDTAEAYSVLVTIPGPVSRLELFHTQNGPGNSGINVTDVYFDVPGVLPLEGAGGDTLLGGDGDDVIRGEGGNDSLLGGAGADVIDGGADADTIVGGTDGDVVDGGTGSSAPGDANDDDILDLSGDGPFRVINETLDADGNSTSGTVEFLDASSGDVTGTLAFTEIETILGNRIEDGVEVVAADNAFTLDEDDPPGGVEGNVLSNDSAPADTTLRVVSVSNGTDTASVSDPFGRLGQGMVVSGDNGGVIRINNGGNVLFNANGDFEGLAGGESTTTSVTYTISDRAGSTDTATVTFTVTGVNDAPDAVDDGDVTDFETAVVIDLLANDTDLDGDTLSVTSASVPSVQGSLEDLGGGAYRFTPADGFEGVAVVSYAISDGNGGTDNAAHVVQVNADPTPADGIVDGEDFAETMGPGYNDANLPSDGGGDQIDGDDGLDDVIAGNGGDDTIDAGLGDDVVRGGDGDDLLLGGQGADRLDGGDGDDVFDFDAGQDGAGDTIVGGEDVDSGDRDKLDLSGSGPLRVIFDDSVDPTGTPGEAGTVIFYTDTTQTEVAGRLTFREIENVVPCFTPGAMIATPRGELPVENLRVGDKVITRDNGIQEIRWTGKRTLTRMELADHLNTKPIFIKAGALGQDLPERDMLVSPQHRVLIAGETPQLYFEESEVLVAAKHLVGRQGIGIMDTLRATYIHFMFDRHEVVLSDGAWTESFQPGDQSLGALASDSRDEIIALFPELATRSGLTNYAAARRALKAHEATLLHL